MSVQAGAQALRKLFPGFRGNQDKSKLKRMYDPSDDCVVSCQKRKKKSTSVRMKPRTFPVVLLRKKTMFVPKRYSRQRLNKEGRIQKVVLRRNMSADVVKCTIVRAFASFHLEDMDFLRCGQDNVLSVVKEIEMCGDAVFEVAGQGSLYLVACSLNVSINKFCS